MEEKMYEQTMTAEEAAKFLRDSAEATAKMSHNWDNYEKICRDMIDSALKHYPEIDGATGPTGPTGPAETRD